MSKLAFNSSIRDEILRFNKKDPVDRIRAVSCLMGYLGDQEMADVLRTYAAQLEFGDNMEAVPAIRRTEKEIDKMIEDRKRHCAGEYLYRMTDDMVMALSSGEVKCGSLSYDTSSFSEEGLYDPDTFGGDGRIPIYNDERNNIPVETLGTGMGHISLPAHVVFDSDHALIARITGKTKQEIADVAHYLSYVVMDPGSEKLSKWDIVSPKDVGNYETASFITGGNAIYEMLKSLELPDKPERLAFSKLLAVSPVARPVAWSKKEEKYMWNDLAALYDDLMNSIKFYHNIAGQFSALGNPQNPILLNQQRAIASLVNRIADNARESLDATTFKNCRNEYMTHIFYQLRILLRYCAVSAAFIPAKKCGDIESLHIYPDTITVLQPDGSKEQVSFLDVVHACEKTISDSADFQTMTQICSLDEDEDVPEYLNKKYEEYLNHQQEFEDILSSVKSGASQHREKFTVKRTENGMYVPV